MAFDPDKYLAQKAQPVQPTSGGFDPDKYLKDKGVSAEGSGILNNIGENLKSVDAFGTGVGNTMTLGYLPQIEAGIGAGVDTVGSAVKGDGLGSLEDLQNAYQTNKDRVLQHQEQLQQDRPTAYTAGSLAGIFSNPVKGVGKIAAYAPNKLMQATGMAKNLPALSKLLVAGGTGATIAAAANPGDTKGQSGDLQLDQRLNNAELGGGLGVLGEGLSQTIQKSPEWVDSIRRWMASKQLGANTSQMKQLLKELPDGEGMRLDRIEKFMDQNGMLNMGTHFSDVEDQASGMAKDAGQKLEGLYKGADALAPEAMVHPNPTIADKMQATRLHGPDLANEFIKQEASRLADTADGDEIVKTLQNKLGTPDAEGSLTKMGSDVSLQRLWKYRQSVDENINFAAKQGNATLARSYVNLRNFLNDKIMSRVGAIDEAAGTSHLPDIQSTNQVYSDANMVKNITNNTKAREYSKFVPGLVGMMGGAGAGVYAHEHGESLPKSIAYALGTGLALRGARAIAPALTYRGATAIEPGLEALKQNLQANPGAGGQLLTVPWLNMQRKNQ